MRSTSFWRFSLAAATIFGLTENCAADPLGFLGSAILETQAQASREAWARVPELDRFCVARALDAQGTNLPSVIRSGIMPGDPRLASFEAQCRRLNGAA